MSAERWVHTFEVGGQSFEAECIRRPFREGIEVRIALPGGEVVSVAELGLGERALLEKAKALLEDALGREGAKAPTEP